jgi:prevent-host-death family protein
MKEDATIKRVDNRSFYGTVYGPEENKMNISKDIKPITYLKSKAPDLLKQINETRRPVVITQNGEPSAVLQDPESYENMRAAIGILKLISQGEDDVKNGKTRSQEQVFTTIENVLKKKTT